MRFIKPRASLQSNVVFTTTDAPHAAQLTLSLPSSDLSTFSQPFKEKCIGEVVRNSSIIIFHLSKAMKKCLH